MISPISPLDWDDHLARYPEATFYHTRIWARILTSAFPSLRDESRWRDCPGGRAAFPFFAWRRLGGLLTTRQSSFPFLYGGPVPRTIGGRDLMKDVLEENGHGSASLVVISNPFAGGASIRMDAIGRESDSTHILRLPSRYEEYSEKILTTAKRNDIRRLAKHGVVVRLGGTEDEIATVHGLYRKSFARWGGTPGFVYPEAFYHAIVDLGEGYVRLYLAEHEGKIAGAAFVVRWNGHVHYHAGYFDHDARALRPNVLIQERVIRDAITDRFRDYDFLPSGGNKGVEEFKESFGGVRTPIVRYVYQAPLNRAASLVRSMRGGVSSASHSSR
jgi:hypothetical protein